MGWAGDNLGHSDFKGRGDFKLCVCRPATPTPSPLLLAGEKIGFTLNAELDEIV